ncbi:DUF3221 domain-containing protein [Cytobacillus sp. Hm23]
MALRISLLIFTIFMLLSGCNSNEEYSAESDFIGEIIKFNNKTIEMEVKQGVFFEQGNTGNIILSYGKSVDKSSLEKGKKFKVWIDGEVLDSSPMQATIGKIEVFD